MLGFTFTIHENPNKTYGRNVGGTWTGMIGEVNTLSQHFFIPFFIWIFCPFPHFPIDIDANQVISGEADIALADMTITSTRYIIPSLSVDL